jgi:outer membrane immunogenic protein
MPFIPRSLLLAAGLAAAAGSAAAADLPAPLAMPAPPPPSAPPPTWTGWYTGLNAGAVLGDESVSWQGTGGFSAAAVADIANSSPGNARTTGFTGGGQLGYNFQFQSLVAGLEADLQYTGVDGTRSVIYQVFLNPYAQSVDSHWLSTTRGRLGFAYGPWLIYGTGGLAVAHVGYNDNFLGRHGVGPINSPSSYTAVGWTAGGGAEWMFVPRWSAKVEYLFVDIGSQTNIASTVDAVGVAVITHMHSLTENIARLGVNYRWAE